jgi:FtsZ-interacting cell division protein ZipA
MLERLSARVIAYIVGGVLLVGIVLFGLNECRAKQTAKKQAEVSQGEAGASISSGAAAVNTVGAVTVNDAATDAAVAQGQADIHSAPEGQKSAATKRAACRLRAYQDTPQCKGPAR